MTLERRSLSDIPESPDNLKIRDALVETLARAKYTGIDLYLTGGTAAAAYAGETRPLSLDLDFFVEPTSKARVQEVFGGNFRYFGEKKLFKSDKLMGHAGNGVDLDFIAEQNIVPDETKPEEKITLKLGQFAKKKALERDFMGERVLVMPPEMVVIAKLFAGRGIELGKYDLADSEAVIVSGIIRPDFFRRAAEEIAGGDETTIALVQGRLMAALQKLTFGSEIDALMKAVEAMENGPLSRTSITDIQETMRRRTLPDRE